MRGNLLGDGGYRAKLPMLDHHAKRAYVHLTTYLH
jgi:hypothetical protein